MIQYLRYFLSTLFCMIKILIYILFVFTYQVRAAVVFALGTFISSERERTEHANSLDQQVAVNLAKIAYEEMSPIVRAELLAGIYIQLNFDYQIFFCTFFDLSFSFAMVGFDF